MIHKIGCRHRTVLVKFLAREWRNNMIARKITNMSNASRQCLNCNFVIGFDSWNAISHSSIAYKKIVSKPGNSRT